VAFTSDRRNKDIDRRIGKANMVLHVLYSSMVAKWELSVSNTAKF